MVSIELVESPEVVGVDRAPSVSFEFLIEDVAEIFWGEWLAVVNAFSAHAFLRGASRTLLSGRLSWSFRCSLGGFASSPRWA